MSDPENNVADETYTRTPILKRLPTVASLVAALVVARIFGHALWSGLLLLIATFIVCVLILRFVFRQPLDRVLGYKEFKESPPTSRQRPARRRPHDG